MGGLTSPPDPPEDNQAELLLGQNKLVVNLGEVSHNDSGVNNIHQRMSIESLYYTPHTKIEIITNNTSIRKIRTRTVKNLEDGFTESVYINYIYLRAVKI